MEGPKGQEGAVEQRCALGDVLDTLDDGTSGERHLGGGKGLAGALGFDLLSRCVPGQGNVLDAAMCTSFSSVS